ncbi:MAG: Zn-ribbon domain-containing OB-fold protein [Dehalococcoidia bacterium]
MTTSLPFPTPVPGPEGVEFWEGCKRGELLIQQCSQCGKLRYYPRPACNRCSSEEYSWHKASGKATLYSWIVVHHPTLPVFKDRVPYAVILVELDEGVRMISNIVDCENEDLRIGMPLEVTFDRINEDVTLPKFRPVGA